MLFDAACTSKINYIKYLRINKGSLVISYRTVAFKYMPRL